MTINLVGEEIDLLPQKAFYWKKERLLGFSDVHLGKAESLQTFGIPIPGGQHIEELKRINHLIQITNAKNVVILGDLIHQKNSWTSEIRNDLIDFFASHNQIQWQLLVGNHERGSAHELNQLPIQVIENELTWPPFLLTHGHTSKSLDLFAIQGHVHPVIKLQHGSTRLRLPCFVVNDNSLTLPSFGSLTGGYEIKMQPNQRIFAVTSSSVFQVQK